jgi:ankyrin repeat protein/L-ascorbate metabolism protein UlaG (beta-lactamase superfamily)
MKKNLIAFVSIAAIICFSFLPSFSQDIFTAVDEGNLEAVKKLLDKDPELLSQRNADLLTPLNLAAGNGQVEMVDFLLQKGADPSIGDRENSQPIHLAALNGHIPVVDILLAKKVDIDSKDDNLMTPLLFAASRGQVDMTRHLVALGADVKAKNINGFGGLLMAAISGNTELVRLFVEKGAKVSEKSSTGFTALHSAASYGRTEIVKYLIDKGADVEAETESGGQPLSLAVGRNSYDAAVILIENGADVNHKDHNGFTALHEAAGRGNIQVARLLIEHGADINAATPDGFVPLAYAAFADNAGEMARLLILSGADVNPDPCKSNKSCTCGPNFRTPLHAACDMAKIDVVKILVENGARVNLFSNTGLSPLHYAVKSGNQEVVSYLLDHGAFLNVKDNREGWTELHLAAALGYSQMASLLLDKGSCPKVKNNDGKTPLDLAYYYGQDRIAYEMLASGADETGLKSFVNQECLLSKTYDQGQAEIWYLGHSGWAIKTQNHLLVFDYFINSRAPGPEHACLNSGCINADELKNMKMDVFSTHGHGDHYSNSYFDWDDNNPDVTYIFCHTPTGVSEEYNYVPVHSEAEIDGMKIYVNHSSDEGGGFLVEVDGLTIFHMGDHANGSDVLSEEFTNEIDIIAQQNKQIDVLFAPIRGCSLGTPDQVKAGVYYTLDKLNPSLFFPMHTGIYTTENKAFADQIARDGIKVPVKYSISRGDRFFYDKSQLEAKAVNEHPWGIRK